MGIKNLIKYWVTINRLAASSFEQRWPEIFGAPSYKDDLLQLINKDFFELHHKTVLEVGGIDRPLLRQSTGFEYIGLDIEKRDDCSLVYDRFIVQSIEKPVTVQTDMVISITLMEHVENNQAAVDSIFGALRPGGVTHHYIPSKWHPYSVALRMVGPKLQGVLIPLLRPEAVGVTGYPAYFDYCSPASMKKLFAQAGFVDVRTRVFYRASDYFAFFLPAYFIVSLYENLCKFFNISIAGSGFIISARRPPATITL